MQLNNPINLLYCGDQKTEDGLILSLLSILRNQWEPLDVYARN